MAEWQPDPEYPGSIRQWVYEGENRWSQDTAYRIKKSGYPFIEIVYKDNKMLDKAYALAGNPSDQTPFKKKLCFELHAKFKELFDGKQNHFAIGIKKTTNASCRYVVGFTNATHAVHVKLALDLREASEVTYHLPEEE